MGSLRSGPSRPPASRQDAENEAAPALPGAEAHRRGQRILDAQAAGEGGRAAEKNAGVPAGAARDETVRQRRRLREQVIDAIEDAVENGADLAAC